MKTQHTVAPRTATTLHRSTIAASGLLLALGLGACSPGASVAPVRSVALPSIDASAAASALSGAAMTALDQVDKAITTTQTDGTLTAEATSLTQLTAGVRTALTSGDTAAARAAINNLNAKIDSFAAKLGAGAGPQLKVAIDALKAALPAS